MSSQTNQSVTYSSYLALDQLLGAKNLTSTDSGEVEHDELLFIIIHQVYELWFKQLLHELYFAIKNFSNGELGLVLHTLKRIRTIFKVIVGQLDVLETMTPLQFSSFRDRLASSSGLQSFQFRELEFALGLTDPGALDRYVVGSAPHKRLQKRLKQPTIWTGFLQFLITRNLDVPTNATTPDPRVQDILISIYKSDAELTQICEALIDVDEGRQEWRYRHVKMDQRTIDTKSGTSGTDGVEYLKSTLDKHLFPDLWAVRAKL